MLEFSYFIIIIFAILFQNMLKKTYADTSHAKATFMFSAFVCVGASIFFTLTNITNLNFTSRLIPYCIFFAVGYGAITVFSVLALKHGSLSITSLIISYSLILPTLFGIFYYKESVDILFYIGMILLLLSLALINRDSQKIKVSFKWIIYALLAFFGNGLCGVVMQVQSKDFKGEYGNEFMIISLCIVAITLIIVSLFTEREDIRYLFKNKIHMPFICGVLNGIQNLFTLMLLSIMYASFVNPMIAGGGIIATCIVSVFFYKEKLSVYQLIGVTLGTLSVVFLSI